MKGVFTKITMNMDGVQFNILYINGKCITIKKKINSHTPSNCCRYLCRRPCHCPPPAMIPPPLPPAELHSPPPSSPPRMSLDASAVTIANADRSHRGHRCPHRRRGGASPSTLHPTRTTTLCAMNSRATILPTKAAAVRED